MVKWYLLIQRGVLYYLYLGHSVRMSAGFSLTMLAKFRGVIAWDFDAATHVCSGYYLLKSSPVQTIPKMYWFAINSILSGLIRQDKEYFSKKKKFTVGCHRKRPKLMRSNKERTCAGKAIIGKRHIIVIFAVLNILQLVIQHCSGNCLTVTGHIDNTARIQYWCCQIFKMSFCVVLHDIVWYFMVFTCIDTLIEVIFKSFASFSSAQCKLNYTVNDPGWPD